MQILIVPRRVAVARYYDRDLFAVRVHAARGGATRTHSTSSQGGRLPIMNNKLYYYVNKTWDFSSAISPGEYTH